MVPTHSLFCNSPLYMPLLLALQVLHGNQLGNFSISCKTCGTSLPASIWWDIWTKSSPCVHIVHSPLSFLCNVWIKKFWQSRLSGGHMTTLHSPWDKLQVFSIAQGCFSSPFDWLPQKPLFTQWIQDAIINQHHFNFFVEHFEFNFCLHECW